MPSPPSVTPTRVDGYAGLRLASAGDQLMATFLPGLGMVGCSLRHRGEELLAQRGGVSAYAQRGSTFGLPLLHPWANRLAAWSYGDGGRRVTIDPHSAGVRRDGASGLPIHGLLAASPHWRVEDRGVHAGEARLRAVLDFGAHPDLLDSFPFPHRLALEVGVTEERLQVRTTMIPTAAIAVPVAFGFHPYLRLPGARSDCTLTLPVRRRMILDDRGVPTGRQETLSAGALDGALGTRGFDDCFDELRPTAGGASIFSVAAAGRQTSLSLLEGFPVAQVFSPPASDFVCFEPMTAPVNALVSGQGLRLIAPGERFSAAFAITPMTC